MEAQAADSTKKTYLPLVVTKEVANLFIVFSLFEALPYLQ